jgi:DNA-binding response OmpR family regulator
MENLSAFLKKGSARRVSASRKVLIVEDDLFLAAIVGRAVYDINPDCDIDWATSLEQALSKMVQEIDELGRSPYHLVVADVMLDGRGTGLDLWKVFCRTYPQVPVMLISSLTQNEIFKDDSAQDNRASVNYLKKPFSMGELKNNIRVLFN